MKGNNTLHLTCAGLSFGDLQGIRAEAAVFLEAMHTPRAQTGSALLILTEILSNLIKHPKRKPTYVEIIVLPDPLSIEVRDNATPFGDFRVALGAARRNVAGGTEGGYGIACILSLCAAVRYRRMKDGTNSFVAELGVPQQHKKKIFLVDDDEHARAAYGMMLERVHTVHSFASAQEALHAFTREKPDLVISDLAMPEMDGISLRAALARVKNGDTTPFIFLSGRAEAENDPSIARLGVDGFLCKPVMRERLLAVTERLLHRNAQMKRAAIEETDRGITKLLSPHLPKRASGWDFQVKSAVAGAGGGDFILHQEGAQNLTIVLADVTGHGRESKFFACAYAGYLRGLFRVQEEPPARFLSRLSCAIAGDPLLETMPMTCLCGAFGKDGLLRVSSAGHPPPIIISEGKAEIAAVSGPLPGLMPELEEYDTTTATLQQGNTALFMTDGFLEAFDHHGHAAEKIVTLLNEIKPKNAADFLWKLYTEQAADNPNDDATLITATRHA